MPEQLVDRVAILQALGEPRRLGIVLALVERDRDVEDLSQVLGLGQPTVSHHLRILRDCGLVTRRRVGRFQDYRLLPTPLRELGAWLDALGQRPDNETQAARYRDLVIEDFLELPLPRVLPTHPRKRLQVSRWLLDQLDTGRFYTGAELADWLETQVRGWQDLLGEWIQQRELDGNGDYYRKP
jgi:ArsR family transcriptional regulator